MPLNTSIPITAPFIHAFRMPTTRINTDSGAPMLFPRINAHGIGTQVIAQGTAIVGQFSASTRYTRKSVVITADAAGLGLRDKNLVLFVAEVREALVHRYGADPYRLVSIST